MTSTCDACRAPIATKQSIRCKKCSGDFHLECVNLSQVELTAEINSDWACPTCRSKIPKGDNTHTPIRSSTTKTSGRENVTLRNRKEADLSSAETTSEVTMILSEVRLMRQDMNDFKHQLKVATESNNKRMDEFDCSLKNLQQQFNEVTKNYNNRMEEFDNSLYASVQRLSGLEETQPDVTHLEQRLEKLTEVVQFQLQSSLRNEVEIIGIPESSNENLTHIVRVVASRLGEDLLDCELDWVERVGPKLAKGPNGERSRLVVVRFVRRAKRDAFLKSARARRNFMSSDLQIDGPAVKVYFNERLTKPNRQLFQEARRRTKLCGFKHCWTSYGTVLIRKEDGRPAISIRSQADLDRHLKSGDVTAAPTAAASVSS